jgi:hypothetical protein
MTTPLLIPVGVGGLNVYVTGWAATNKEGGTIVVSFIGRPTAAQGVWAGFMSNMILSLPRGRWPHTHEGGHEYYDSRPSLKRLPGEHKEYGRYRTFRQRLPETGWAHYVVIHNQATTTNGPDLPFFLVSFNGSQPDLALFWTLWNKASPLPARAEWTSRLWELGKVDGLISPVPSEGLLCWQVQAAGWESIVQKLAKE